MFHGEGNKELSMVFLPSDPSVIILINESYQFSIQMYLNVMHVEQ